MSAGSYPWQAILWVERFLPKPRPTHALSDAERSIARRRAAFVPLLVVLTITMPAVVRARHQLGPLLRQNHVALEQLMLVVAACIAVAAIGVGVMAWRDAKGVC